MAAVAVVEQSCTNQKISGSIPSSSSPHVDVSLIPELLPMAVNEQ